MKALFFKCVFMFRIKPLCLSFVNQRTLLASSETLGAIQFLVHMAMKLNYMRRGHSPKILEKPETGPLV